MKVEEFNDILYEKDESTGIVMVTLNAPKRKNAMSFITSLELFYAVQAMEEDDGARAMIITGAKDPDCGDPTKEAFSSGGYFTPELFKNIPEEIKDEVDLTDLAAKRLCLKLFYFEKPVIAAINGMAIGAGFTMPLSGADLIYMSEHAWIEFPFVGRLGILPEFALTYFLPRMMGFQKAKEIVYFSKRILAQQALEWGWVNEVVPHEELIPHAQKMALKLIPPEGPGLAVKLAKRAFHQPYVDAVTKALGVENQGLNQAMKSHDFSEGLKARKEKRPPVFKGE
ncbi:enoyl-CoA hydratase/isomerase family protein [Thermodesulfobacteriota bacterium]